MKMQAKVMNAHSAYKIGGVDDDLIKFGDDNLFPNATQELLRNSPVLRGGLVSKINFSLGTFSFDNDTAENAWAELNATEHGDAVFKKIMQDYQNGGNAFLEIVRVGNTVSFFHIDWTKVRRTKKGFIINPDWTNREKKKDVKIAEYPNWTKRGGGLHSLVHIRDYESGFDNYGIPEWVAGLNASTIAWKTDKWNLSRLKNSLAPSGIVFAPVSSQEEADELFKTYQKDMQGEYNVGKVMFVTAGGLEGKASFTPITSTNEGDWVQLRESSRQDIITALNWFDVLMGQSKSGQLGNTQELRNVYQIALHNVIRPKQRIFEQLFERLLSENLGSLRK